MINYPNLINKYNSWHFDPSFRIKTDEKKRYLFDKLRDYLTYKTSISISGLRRVGKTTLMYQLINRLLQDGISSKRILYFQFDQESTKLEEVLNIYFLGLPKDDLYRKDFYIFLDELQFVKGWQNIIKRYIDLNNGIRFIVSGSTSLYLHRDIKESLAGRMIDLKLSPMKFGEFLFLKENYQEELSIKKCFFEGNKRKDKLDMLAAKRSLVKDLFSVYLKQGEFPALLNVNNTEYVNDYLSTGILQKILRKDIKIFEVEKVDELEILFRVCAANTAQVINLTNTAREIGLSLQTVKRYLSILEKAYLIDLVKNRLSSIRSRELAQDKVFFTSINLFTNILGITEPSSPLNLAFKGHIVETYIYNKVKNWGNVYFYNRKGKEVDLVVEGNEQISGQSCLIPIEVKSSSVVKSRDFNHLFFYLNKNKVDVGYLVYAGDKVLEERRVGKVVYVLPYWVF